MRRISELSLVFFLFVIACTKIDTVSAPTIDLGKAATSTSITNISSPITSGAVTVELAVTPGAKYSLQLIDLKGDVKSSSGFVADSTLVIKKLDYSNVNPGDYTLQMIDIAGKESKRTLTIKK